MKTVKAPWRNRIIGYGEIAPEQALANDKNWRIHPKPQQDSLSGVLSDVGVVQNVIINKRTDPSWGRDQNVETVVDGHLRISLAISAGQPTVPVTYVDLDRAEEAEILATLDPLAAMAATDSAQLDSLLQSFNSSDAAVGAMLADLAKEAGLYLDKPVEAPEAQIDKAEELRVKWGTAAGQLWEIPSKSVPGKAHRLLCGDSTKAEDVARLMGTDKAEMVWTDPPYGVAIGDKNKMLNAIARSNRVEENLANDTLDEPSLVRMLEGAFDSAMVHCLAGAAWYVAAPAGPLHVLFGQVLKDRGIWRQTIQWVKNNATFSPMGVDYHWRAEPIFYGWLPNAGHRYYGGRTQNTVWEIDRPSKSPEHPTMKPVELVSRAIENSSQSGQIVYDPFLGSGTTMVAAEQLGRLGYGNDVESKYVAVALQRLADMGLVPRLASS